MLDKMLSLRLNRPSVIQDRDITIRFEKFEADDYDGLAPIISKWVQMLSLQGKVYDLLYSPGALRQRETQRESQARALAADVQRVFDSKSPAEVCSPHKVERSMLIRNMLLSSHRSAFLSCSVRVSATH